MTDETRVQTDELLEATICNAIMALDNVGPDTEEYQNLAETVTKLLKARNESMKIMTDGNSKTVDQDLKQQEIDLKAEELEFEKLKHDDEIDLKQKEIDFKNDDLRARIDQMQAELALRRSIRVDDLATEKKHLIGDILKAAIPGAVTIGTAVAGLIFRERWNNIGYEYESKGIWPISKTFTADQATDRKKF